MIGQILENIELYTAPGSSIDQPTKFNKSHLYILPKINQYIAQIVLFC